MKPVTMKPLRPKAAEISSDGIVAHAYISDRYTVTSAALTAQPHAGVFSSFSGLPNALLTRMRRSTRSGSAVSVDGFTLASLTAYC